MFNLQTSTRFGYIGCEVDDIMADVDEADTKLRQPMLIGNKSYLFYS